MVLARLTEEVRIFGLQCQNGDQNSLTHFNSDSFKIN